MLAVTVPEEHYETALATLEIVRSGLAQSHLTSEANRACAFFGPFEAAGADQELVYALGNDLDGLFDPKEPDHIREHAILAGARALVAAAS